MQRTNDERAALDLAATLGAAGGGPRDLLASPTDLERWLQARPDLGDASPELALRLGDFRELRDAIRDAAVATAEGRPLPTDAIRVLNDASGAVSTAVRLDASGGTPRLERVTHGGSPAAVVLGRIASGAIELVGGPDREHLRVCPARGCGRVFLSSRPGRIWCSASCGNRTRVARHQARSRMR